MIKLTDLQFKLIVLLAFAINLLFRLYGIDLSPFSYDESISLKDTLIDFGHLKHEAEWDSNPPFYHYCLWVWAKLFGHTEFALRSFSAVLALLTMLIAALFISKNFSKLSSFVFIVLFSVHPVIFYYSQEARCYSLILFLACLTLISFINFLKSPSLSKALLLGLLNFLLIYTHYITFYIPLFQVFIVIIFNRSAIKWFTVSALLSLTLVFIRFTKGQFELILGTSSNASSRAWLKKASFEDLSNFISKMYFHHFLYLLLIGYLAYFLYKYRNTIKVNHKLINFLFMLSVFTPILHFIIGLVIPLFVDRYILYSVMFTFILVSISTHYSKYAYIISIFIAVFGFCQIKLTYKKDFDFKSVANYVNVHQRDRSVIIHTKDLNGLFTYYYDKEQYMKMDENGNFNLRDKKIFTARTINDFKQLPLDLEKDIMLFQGFDNEAQNEEIYGYFISKGYSLLKINGFHGIKFILLTK
jgi:uncharacterized membrane protein